MNNEAKIMDMFYRSETKPRIRERLISREQYLEFLEGQLEENKVALRAGRGRRGRDNDAGPIRQAARKSLCLILQ